MKHAAAIATFLIVLRQAIATLHGMAHEHLGVGLSPMQQAFVVVVITIAPFVALVLYWTRYARQGALLLRSRCSRACCSGFIITSSR